jgi:hypothetical protein
MVWISRGPKLLKDYHMIGLAKSVGGISKKGGAALSAINIAFSSNANTPNLTTLATSAGWNGSSAAAFTITVNSGVNVGQMSIPNWPAGSTCRIDNNGKILGMGGASGSSGTDALTTAFANTQVYNYSGAVIGGGGGGGGQGSGWTEPQALAGAGAGPGGAGAGYQNNGVAQAGTAGTSFVIEGTTHAVAGNGGSGGSLGNAGQSGTTGWGAFVQSDVLYRGDSPAAQSGGSPGKAIAKTGSGTYTVVTNAGNIYGVQQ